MFGDASQRGYFLKQISSAEYFATSCAGAFTIVERRDFMKYPIDLAAFED